VVDVQKTPIEGITTTGVRTEDLMFATGFNAMTGPFDKIHIRSRDRQLLRDKCAEGPRTYLGGLGPYRQKCEEVAANGYEGFAFADREEPK
jgi:hypothetical protein